VLVAAGFDSASLDGGMISLLAARPDLVLETGAERIPAGAS
jgi:hypothetical protein